MSSSLSLFPPSQILFDNWHLFLLAASMGFGVNGMAFMVIQKASSLTLKILGTVKNAGLVWLGVLLFGESVTLMQGGGYIISLVGFGLYNYYKMQQQ